MEIFFYIIFNLYFIDKLNGFSLEFKLNYKNEIK